MDTSFYTHHPHHHQPSPYPRDAANGYVGVPPTGVGGGMGGGGGGGRGGSSGPYSGAQPSACYYARGSAAHMVFGGQTMSVVDQMGVGGVAGGMGPLGVVDPALMVGAAEDGSPPDGYILGGGGGGGGGGGQGGLPLTHPHHPHHPHHLHSPSLHPSHYPHHHHHQQQQQHDLHSHHNHHQHQQQQQHHHHQQQQGVSSLTPSAHRHAHHGLSSSSSSSSTPAALLGTGCNPVPAHVQHGATTTPNNHPPPPSSSSSSLTLDPNMGSPPTTPSSPSPSPQGMVVLTQPPPAHSQQHSAGMLAGSGALAACPAQGEDQAQQQQRLQFPWMKTTKSHAHQWKAQWPGRHAGAPQITHRNRSPVNRGTFHRPCRPDTLPLTRLLICQASGGLPTRLNHRSAKTSRRPQTVRQPGRGSAQDKARGGVGRQDAPWSILRPIRGRGWEEAPGHYLIAGRAPGTSPGLKASWCDQNRRTPTLPLNLEMVITPPH
ncbi:hypothetical protein ACOMHN_049023 [Nucella lapillus]